MAVAPSARWTDVDWSAHQCWVGAVNVISLGEGPAVLFVHGLGGAWQNWLENLAPVADAGFRAVALDLPGFGASPLAPGEVSIPGYAAVVDGVLDGLGLDDAVLVGNSMGGFISTWLALASAARVRGLVLVSPAGVSIQDPDNARRLAFIRRTQPVLARLSRLQATHSVGVARRARLRRTVMRYATAHPERLDPRLVAEHIRWADGPGYLAALDALTTCPLRERLVEVAAPTLVVHGADDRLVPVADADVFAAAIPGARKLVYDDTGHLAMLEQPARFNADLLAFLGRLP